VTILLNINHFVALFVESFKKLGLGKVWGLLVLYTLFMWLVLYAHFDFLSPVFYGLISVWLSILGSLPGWWYPAGTNEFFVHYPGHFLALPLVFSNAEFILGVLLESVTLGAVALLFFKAFTKNSSVEAGRGALQAWLQLALLWLIIQIILMAVQRLMPLLLADQLYGKRLLLYRWVLLPGMLSVVFALFYYSVAAIPIYGMNAFQAIRRSIRLAVRRPFTAFFLAALILFVPMVVSQINDPAQIVDKFRPELV
jgi:hypothetical protein